MDVLDAEAEVTIEPTTYVAWRSRPDLAALDKAADLLASAKRPMLMVGDSVSAADAQSGATAIRERHNGPARDEAVERRKAAEARVAGVRERYWTSARERWDAAPITAPRLMHEIKQALPENHLVFAEGVTNSRHIEMALAPDEP